jgi:hypothetical protein
VFAVAELKIHSQCISTAGVAHLRDKVQVILYFPTSTNSSYVGMKNFYHRFLSKIAWTLRPLTAALADYPNVLTWLPTMPSSFAAAKAALVAALPLAHQLPRAVLSLAMDASNTHAEAFFQQQVGQHWLPLGFYSKKLSKTVVNYSTFDRELLAAISGIKHFCSHLQSRLFQL